MGQRTLFFGAAAAGLMLIGYGSGFAQVAWQQVLHFIALEGKPVAASPPLVSEHELQELARMTPQQLRHSGKVTHLYFLKLTQAC